MSNKAKDTHQIKRASCRSIAGSILSQLSDDFVSPRQHVRRNSKAELLGGFQVDNELQFGWLFNRKIRWSGTF
jgi:hypothetical protein